MKKIVIGNWKMNPVSEKLAEKLFISVAKSVSGIKKTEIVVCPPVLYLGKLKKHSRKIGLGAQNIFYGDAGAYTGEISAEMVYSVGGKYVILGHSERRALGESNEIINKKIKSALSVGLVPILCVGEKERGENHEYFNLVKIQIEDCLDGVKKDLLSKIIIAYEPIWAISTTPDHREATGDDFYEMNVFIRKILSDKFGAKNKMPKIIYGGSVNPKNAYEFLKEKNSDGVLVGNASLNVKKFEDITNIAESIKYII